MSYELTDERYQTTDGLREVMYNEIKNFDKNRTIRMSVLRNQKSQSNNIDS